MNKIIFKTDRTYAKAFEENDLDNLYALHTNPMVASTTIDGIQTLEKIRFHLQSFIEHQNKYGFSQWAIYENETNNFMGRAGFTKRKLSDGTQEEVEIRFAILPDFWNKGYASELTKSLVEYAAQELGLAKLAAGNNPDNIKSIKILSKFGFEFIKKIQPKGYGRVDDIDYRELLL